MPLADGITGLGRSTAHLNIGVTNFRLVRTAIGIFGRDGVNLAHHRLAHRVDGSFDILQTAQMPFVVTTIRGKVSAY
jgi:hypothetical protein